MPDPQADPRFPQVWRTAWVALGAGVGITALKFVTFALTNSVAVLTDALESIINVAAAGAVIFALRVANRPADREHPYGHGKAEFLAVGLEGWLILIAGLTTAFEAVRRLLAGTTPQRLDTGLYLLAVVGLLSAALAVFVYTRGRRLDSQTLVADGKHLLTDVASTVGVIGGLVLVRVTGKAWLDPLVALVMAALILTVSWRLLWQSLGGLMDRLDPEDDAKVRAVLDEEVAAGAVRSYHKVRHRHSGAFHWVDLHLQVDGDMTVRQSHELASRIEGRIEEALGQANATAHVEPAERA